MTRQFESLCLQVYTLRKVEFYIVDRSQRQASHLFNLKIKRWKYISSIMEAHLHWPLHLGSGDVQKLGNWLLVGTGDGWELDVWLGSKEGCKLGLTLGFMLG